MPVRRPAEKLRDRIYLAEVNTRYPISFKAYKEKEHDFFGRDLLDISWERE